MEVRITKLRVALAALFVLAGVGLASLLSPLVGTALATVGQTVNISDNSASAYFAKVSSEREVGRRRRGGAAERRRDRFGSPCRARLSLAGSAQRPGNRGSRHAYRRTELRTDQPDQPVPLDGRARRKAVAFLPVWRPRAKQRHHVRQFDARRPALAHQRPRRRPNASLVHLPDAAAVEAASKHEGLCICIHLHRPPNVVERRRLLRRLTTRNRAGVPGRVRLLSL